MQTIQEQLIGKIFSDWNSRIVCAGAQLGIYDALDLKTPRTIDEVAKEKGYDATLLYRLMRAIASEGVLREEEGKRFILTEQGVMLRSDHPSMAYYLAMFNYSKPQTAMWEHLPAIMRDGKPDGILREYGKSVFEVIKEFPEDYGKFYNGAVSSLSVARSMGALDALRDYDFSKIHTWCEVAGGHGHLMCSFLKKYPHLKGTVLDLQNVIEQKDQLWANKWGLQSRCNYIAGDMFKDIPVIADAYSCKWILHDWPDLDAVQILRNIRRSAPNGSRMFVVESVVPGPSEPHSGKIIDIIVMLMYGSHERTEAEYVSLFEASGWKFVKTHYPQHHNSMGVLEAVSP